MAVSCGFVRRATERTLDTQGLSESLSLLAGNHRWTWSADIRSVFERLSGFDPTRHPASQVAGLETAQLAALLDDEAFVADVTLHTAAVRELADAIPTSPEVAYFSPEFGITDVAPQYSGGLGILAGDHLKAASDLGVSLCARGPVLPRRVLPPGSVATVVSTSVSPPTTPPSSGCIDTGVMVDIPMARRTVTARVWRMDVGRVALVLLDTDVDDQRQGRSRHHRSALQRRPPPSHRAGAGARRRRQPGPRRPRAGTHRSATSTRATPGS